MATAAEQWARRSLAGKYQFVLAKPRLDYKSLEPGGAATEAIRAAAAKLPFVRAARRMCASPGRWRFADTQFATVAEGTVTGLIGSVALIALWLALAVRSWRLIVPILGTLGLWPGADVVVRSDGDRNAQFVSVSFGVLFVGIAVDFGLQFAVRFREAKHDTGNLAAALRLTAETYGKRHPHCSTGHSGGFSGVVPTALQRGQLGLIAGTEMLIAFFCTMTFLPAAITICRVAACPKSVSPGAEAPIRCSRAGISRS